MTCDNEAKEKTLVGAPDGAIPHEPSLIEHHLGLLLASDLPDLKSIEHIVRDQSDDLDDILNAIEHLVEVQSANLPSNHQVKSVNWRTKLILAELRDWKKDNKTNEDAI